MELIDFIVIGIIALIIGGAIAYIIKEKRSGKKCIGCPYSATCHKKKDDTKLSCGGHCSSCSCGCDKKEESEPK